MAVNANEDQWVVKDIEEWSGVIFSQGTTEKVCMTFWTRSGTIILGASPDLQQMMSSSHMVAQCAGSSLRRLWTRLKALAVIG